MIETVDISRLDIDYILSLPEVIKAKEQISLQSEGSVYFNIHLNHLLREILHEKFDLDLSKADSIPMRWIKGDTKPHIDRSNHIFDKTYLAYLTDSQGELVIDGESYPISKGSAYIFSEGLEHETIGTGYEPRLLLGPISEQGIEVGAATTIYADGQVEIIYIRYDVGSGTTYKINNGPYFGISLPLTIVNTNTSFTLQVLFETDMVLDSDIWYIICGSDNIQFGSNTLNTNGNIPIITIDSVVYYPGLIRNGGYSGPFLPLADGYSNITIKNIGVEVANGSTLADLGGWIGQGYYGRNGINNQIINCYSTGDIVPGGGGIVGPYTAENNGELLINKCFSTGYIGTEAGGIVGNNAANYYGNITITNCYSFGEIGGNLAGGIVGSFANQLTIENCYSLGQISGDNCGGIIGIYYGNNSTNVNIINCYSIGNIIGPGSGGIASGINSGGTALISNCYTTGSVITGTNDGIAPAGPTIINCYSEGDNSSSGWSDINASQYLTGINTTWISIYPNTNYLLKTYNETLYSQSPYTRSGEQAFTTNLGLIQNSNPDFKYYLINQPSGVTYNTTTGAITFGNNIEPGTYTINIVCGIDPPGQFYNYNISSFIFTQSITPNVTPIIPICFPAGTPVLTDQGEVPIDKINKKIHTICGKEIVTITETISSDSYLICIERNSLGNNVPNRKTFISKDHKVLCDKKMVRAEYLIQYIPTIYKVQYNKERLYNVVLREHSTMAVNNLIVETMNPQHILSKIYSGNYTPQEKNKLIFMVNNYHLKQRGKSFIKNNIFTA